MDLCPNDMGVRILYSMYIKWAPIDYGPGSIFYGGPYSMALMAHIGYGPSWIEYGPPRSKLYRAVHILL